MQDGGHSTNWGVRGDGAFVDNDETSQSHAASSSEPTRGSKETRSDRSPAADSGTKRARAAGNEWTPTLDTDALRPKGRGEATSSGDICMDPGTVACRLMTGFDKDLQRCTKRSGLQRQQM